MRLLYLTSAPQGYLTSYFQDHPNLANATYDEQKVAFDYNSYAWVGVWSTWLRPLGYEAQEIVVNAVPLQYQWAREHGMCEEDLSPEAIVLAQAKEFKPEILWFDYKDENLLKALKEQVPSIKLVLGWVGSAVPRSRFWGQMDLVLSCAPETVARLQAQGICTAHLNHCFDPRINERLLEKTTPYELSFIGQIIRGKEFHLLREAILEALIGSDVKLEIFSPSAKYGLFEEVKTWVKMGVYDLSSALQAAGVSESLIKAIPGVGKASTWVSRPMRPINSRLKPYLRPSVYGLAMYQAIRNSQSTLNIHADSSPTYASNMRLYEITGVGTCMITDWRDNLSELFEPDREVITYKSAEECLEKAKYILEHPQERMAIAKNGQLRCLRDHSAAVRAQELDLLIKTHLKRF